MFGFNSIISITFRKTFVPAALTCALTVTQAIAAQELDDGSKARVNLSSKLGMLSATLTGAACRINADIDIPLAQRSLRDARIEIETILDGLELGNKALGIPTPETRSRTIRALHLVRGEWSRMTQALDGLMAIQETEANAAKIAAASGTFANEAEILASEIQAFYTNPNELLIVDALAIQMAGRQRTLAQQLAASACQLHTGNQDKEAELIATMELFEKTLVALRDGLPSVGVRPPPSEPVADRLESSMGIWETKKELVVEAQSSGTLSASAVAEITENSDQLQKAMNDLVILYVLSTPGRDGAILGLLAEMAEQELGTWVKDVELVAAVKAQNLRHASLTQADVDALDLQWRAEAKENGGPLVGDLMSRPVSATLLEKQIATAGFINEIFVMDNLGLNVAQSAVTSDYWQGDEDKWQQSYGGADGAGAVHIGEVEFDDSTGVFQSQVSIPVKDLETGDVIGAITFGVNVQSLM